MKIEHQVVSLELAQKLKELGVKQESLYYFMLPTATGFHMNDEIPNKEYHLDHMSKYGLVHLEDYVSAFTCSELGEMLPKSLKSTYEDDFTDIDEFYVLDITFNLYEKKWKVSYVEEIERTTMRHQEGGMVCDYADTEADARAKCLVYLLENNLITL